MSHQLVWLDLCSGLGGASQPALDRGWKVIRVDIDPRFKPDIVADVRALPLRPFHVDVLWASPPCQEFSKWGMRCFFPDPPIPDLSIAADVEDAIAYFKPNYWVVENVWASRQFLNKLFGQVRHQIPGHTLWSNLAFLLPNLAPHKGSMNGKHVEGKRWGPVSRPHTPKAKKGHAGPNEGGRFATNENDGAEAAKIPYEIGEAICRAVEARNV